MAATSLTNWAPIETDGRTTIAPNRERSAIMQAVGTPHDMSGTDVAQVPTLGYSDVHEGEDLQDNTAAAGKVTVYATTFNGRDKLSERQVEIADNGGRDTFRVFSEAWLTGFHVDFDNACLGTSGARIGDGVSERPFNSVYYEVTTNASAMYEAGQLTYDNGNELIGRLEASSYGGDNLVIMAHPGLKQTLRGIKDLDGQPIFKSYVTADVIDETLFGYRIYWTRGAKVTDNFKQALPGTGNKLMIAVNPQYLAWGEGFRPSTRFIPAEDNPLAFQHILQHRAVEGFALANPFAASVLEVNA